MSRRVDDAQFVRDQYSSENHLRARKSIYAQAEGDDARAFALEAIDAERPRRVLELGGGEGELAELIADRVPSEVIGVDQSERMVDALRANGIDLLESPDTYYELIDKRLPGHGEPIEELKRRKILVDGNPAGGLLLQIFTKTLIGPIFFEIIQRKGDEGFGEGNFRALFESMELDQVRRGVLKPAA